MMNLWARFSVVFVASASTTNAFVSAPRRVLANNPTILAASANEDDSAEKDTASTRRSFLSHAASMPVAAALATSSSSPSLAQTATDITSAATSTSSIVAATATTTMQNIKLPPLGLGAWAWGDSLFWGYDKKNDDELKKVFDYAIQNSKFSSTLIDTAEIYGFGRSENLIGKFRQDYAPEKIQVATKFAALPFRTKATDVVKACRASMQRLGGKPIDLYQIHFPNAWSNAEYWDGLAMAYEEGLVKAVGVSNYGVDAVRACHDALAKRDIPLATNQIQLSLLYRFPVQNGLLQCCQDLGVQVLSYSPLALGMLTGKYTNEAPPQGPRKVLFEKLQTTPDYGNLLATMKDVAKGHGDSTSLSQVALNWARAKQTVPIPGARTLAQVQSNYGALDWSMSPEEVAILDKAAEKVTTFIRAEDGPFPKKDINTGLVMFDS